MNDICGRIKLPFQGAREHALIQRPKALPLGWIKLGFQPVSRIMDDQKPRGLPLGWINLPFQGAPDYVLIKKPGRSHYVELSWYFSLQNK